MLLIGIERQPKTGDQRLKTSLGLEALSHRLGHRMSLGLLGLAGVLVGACGFLMGLVGLGAARQGRCQGAARRLARFDEQASGRISKRKQVADRDVERWKTLYRQVLMNLAIQTTFKHLHLKMY